MIAVDVLTQESDLFYPFLLQDLYLFENGVYIPTPLSTPHKRNYAERAHVITTSHNWQKGAYCGLIFPNWSYVCISFLNT